MDYKMTSVNEEVKKQIVEETGADRAVVDATFERIIQNFAKL